MYHKQTLSESDCADHGLWQLPWWDQYVSQANHRSTPRNCFNAGLHLYGRGHIEGCTEIRARRAAGGLFPDTAMSL